MTSGIGAPSSDVVVIGGSQTVWGSKSPISTCDLRLRRAGPPVRSVRVAFLEGLSGTCRQS